MTITDTRYGIVEDSYFAYKKETTYGVAQTSGLVCLPIHGLNPKIYIESIRPADIQGSMLMPKSQPGRVMASPETITGSLRPELVGSLFVHAFGAATSTDNTDGSYTHAYILPKTASGAEAVPSFTSLICVGSVLPVRVPGCKMKSFSISSDTQNILTFTTEIQGQQFVRDVSNLTPSFTTSPFDYSFHEFSTFTITPSGESSINMISASTGFMVRSFELKYETGLSFEYNIGSQYVGKPLSTNNSKLSLKIGVDASSYFVNAYDAATTFTINATITSKAPTANDPGTSNKHKVSFEIPGMQLATPPSPTPSDGKRFRYDLEFESTVGGTTTNSGSDYTKMEVNVVDAFSTHA